MEAELGIYGGVANRAFKLNGKEIRRGDELTPEDLSGLELRQVRALGAHYVTFYNKAKDAEAAKAVEPKRKAKRK